MKFKTRKTSEITNIKGNKVIQGKIANPAKMLKMFTKDLYKHPLQTSIQEYINNAKDAHIMAKKDTSTIEITAPTVANQNVIIKDYGTGLSPKEIEEIFANITVSNKDNSDLFNGGYGIGSKSWFSINNSFIVVSTHKKVKTYYSINFSEKDGIIISVDHEETTNEKNGLEVILPLANKNQIESAHKAIIRAVNFWTVRPVLKNIDESKLTKFYHREEDYSLISFERDEGNLSVTLGETEYSAKDLPSFEDSLYDCFTDLNVVIHFKVGEMNLESAQEVGPDRESFALACDDAIYKKAKKVLNKIITKLSSDLQKMDNKEDIIRFLQNHTLANSFRYKEFQKKLKNKLTLIFNSDCNFSTPMIKNKRPTFIKVGQKPSSSYANLNQTKGCSHILVKDLDREIKGNELTTIIDTFAIPERKTRWGHYSYGIYVLEKNEYSKAQLKELSNYFKIILASQVKYQMPIKEKKEKPVGQINCTHSSTTSNCNIKYNINELINDKCELILKSDWLNQSKIKDWNKFIEEHRTQKKKKKVVVVSKENFELLLNSGLKVFDFDAFLGKKKQREENALQKNLIRANKLKNYICLIKGIEFMSHKAYSYDKKKIFMGINILKTYLPKNHKIQKYLMSYNELTKSQKEYEELSSIQEDKIKKALKKGHWDNEFDKFIKELERTKPLTFDVLINSSRAKKDELKALISLLK